MVVSTMLPENREMRGCVREAGIQDVREYGGQHDSRRVGAVAVAGGFSRLEGAQLQSRDLLLVDSQDVNRANP